MQGMVPVTAELVVANGPSVLHAKVRFRPTADIEGGPNQGLHCILLGAGGEVMNIKSDALGFFDDCETGRGWAACKQYCTPDASFSAQADALTGVNTLEAYTDWMTGVVAAMPDARYEMLAFGLDEERDAIAAAAIFHATHTGEGGPVPPTGKSVSSD